MYCLGNEDFMAHSWSNISTVIQLRSLTFFGYLCMHKSAFGNCLGKQLKD